MSRNQQYQRRHDEDETDDYDFDHSSSYAMTPQQQRQEERKRHADMATASGTNPYGAKSNKKSKKCKVIGWSTLVILLLAIGGVLAWYFAVFKKNEDKKNDSARGTGGGTIAVGPTGNRPIATLLPSC
ncbi:hypothetical protein BGZ52_001049 [Haplosporangium bisporale]|nr:hypothetical protein BGZ52_001049 [Haplosporangium bisporale]